MKKEDKLKENNACEYIGKKRYSSEQLIEKKELLNIQNKKFKSEGDNIHSEKDFKFIFKKLSNYGEIFQKWEKNIKSLKINEAGQVIKKLDNEELILMNCQQKAIEKLKNLKNIYKKGDILNIISYDNTNKNILYYCFQKLKHTENFNDWIKKYKYCFCDEEIIFNYFNNQEIKVNLKEEFNFTFPFKNINEGINILKETLNNIVLLVDKYNIYYVFKKLSQYDDNFIYELNDKKNIIKTRDDELYNLGYNFLKYYLLIKDFGKFENNQPFSFKNNNILYISFLLNEIYKPLVDLEEENIINLNENNKEIALNENIFTTENERKKEENKNIDKDEIIIKNEDNNKKENIIINDKPKNKIKINESKFSMIYGFIPLIKEIMNDLDNDLKNENFYYKIRFFNILFESDISNAFSEVCCKFLNHFFDIKDLLTGEDIKKLIEIKTTNDKICGKTNIYTFMNDILGLENINGKIEFNIKEYNKNIKEIILKNDEILKYSWQNNSIKSFQEHNFLLKEDINFVKDIMKKIFKSKFWEEMVTLYYDNDFTSNDYFKNDLFIEQLLSRIIFLPFSINNLGLYAFTSSHDLNIYISGYPFIERSYSLGNYTLYRILQLSVLIIVILHESIHFYQRLLFYITCQMIERKTIFNGKEEEGGWLFEDLLFEEVKTKDNTEKIKFNVETALNLLNPKIYEKGIQYVKEIISFQKKEKDKDELLISFLKKIDLIETKKYDKFIKVNKNKKINASKKFLEENAIEYQSSYHKHF